MKTYYMNGLSKEESYFIKDDSLFYIQEIGNDAPDRFIYPNDSIKYELDDALVILYDTLRDVFFEDTSKYYEELSTMPIFVQEAGQDSECPMSAETFAEWIQREEYGKRLNFYKHLYLVDCQFLVGTIQNLLCGMEDAFIRYYSLISSVGNDLVPTELDSTMYLMSQDVGSIAAVLESYFTKAYSILDMLCKICYEIEFKQKDFLSYKKMKSAEILWGAKKKLSINDREKTLFEKCDLVSMIESLRNEVVHNGTWELNPKLYVRFKDGQPVEKFMLFPDISQGRLATVKGRKHFFSCGTKVNEILPKIHGEFKVRLLATLNILNHKEREEINLYRL